MKIQNAFGFTTKNKSVVTNFVTQSILSVSLISLILFSGMFSSAANAQPTTVVLTTGSTWTVPTDADVSSITIECWGAGGAGSYSSTSSSAGGAGGGGAYAQKAFTSFTAGQTVTYEIGIGGSGASGTNDGGVTWFSTNTATGVMADGGKGAVDNSKIGAAGGTAGSSIGDIKQSGGKGGNGSYTSGALCGDEKASGGGGAAAETTATGNAGGNAVTKTGTFGCLGNFATPGLAGTNLLFTGYTSTGGVGIEDSGTGNNGTYGAGGSGGVAATFNGGNGGDGLILITYNNICTTYGTDTQVACKSYTWINGNTYTSSNTTATDTLMNDAGCDSIVTLNLTINDTDVTTTQTEGINLSANATGAIYQWIDCGNGNTPITGENSKNFTALVNGSYAVIVTENGCSDTSACLTVGNVGLNDFNDIVGISIFPNPTNDQVTVRLENLQDGQHTLALIDATGRLLIKQLINENSTNLSLSNYESGVYFIQISNGNKQSIHRVIKK